MSIQLIAAAALAGLVALTATLASSRSVRLLLLAGLFFSSIAVRPDEFGGGGALPTMLAPLQLRRTIILAVIGGLILLSIAIYGIRSGALRTSAQTVALLAVGLYAGLLRVVHEGLNDGVFTAVYALLVIPTVTAATIGYIRSREDIVRIARAVGVVAIAWIGFVALQYLANPSYLLLGISGRFAGLVANPQHAGAFLSSVGLFTIWLVAYDPAKLLRPVWIATSVILGVFILWSGSRTGALMLTVGVVVSLYSRVGRLILLVPLLGILLYVGMKVAGNIGIELATERFSSTENTRQIVWANMLQAGLSNPVTGVGIDETGGSENGYLYGFASYGLGMLTLLIVMTAVSGITALRLFMMRGSVSKDWQSVIDLMLAYIALYYAGGLLEGYFISRVSTNLFLMLIVGGLIVRTFDFARLPATATHHAVSTEPVVFEGPTDWGTGYTGEYRRA